LIKQGLLIPLEWWKNPVLNKDLNKTWVSFTPKGSIDPVVSLPTLSISVGATRRKDNLPRYNEWARYGVITPELNVEPIPAETVYMTNDALVLPQSRAMAETAAGTIARYKRGKTESAFVDSVDSFDRAIDTANRWSSNGWFQWETEVEQYDKFGALSQVEEGWFVATSPLNGKEMSISEKDLKTVEDFVIDYVLRRSRPQRIMNYRYRKNTNHGSPTWAQSNDDLLWHISTGVSARQRGTIMDAAWDLSQALGLPFHSLFSATLFRRSGPNRKPVVSRDIVSGDPVGVSKGYFARSRGVYGLPTYINTFLRPLGAYAKAYMYGLPHCGLKPEQLAMFGPNTGAMNWDYSAYDLSVNFRLQKSMARLYDAILRKEKVPDDLRSKLIESYKQMSIMPIICPPTEGYFFESSSSAVTVQATGETPEMVFVRNNRYGHSYLPRTGVTISGSVLTVTDGTFINLMNSFYCLARSMSNTKDLPLLAAMKKVEDMINNGALELYLQGDDSVVFGAAVKLIDRELFEFLSRTVFGLPLTIGDDPVFLMKIINRKERRAYRLLSRFLQNLFFRERPKSAEEVIRLSVATNVESLIGHPHAFEALEDLQPLFRQRFGVTWQQMMLDLSSGVLGQAAAKSGASFGDWLLGATQGDIDKAYSPEILGMLGGIAVGTQTLNEFFKHHTIELDPQKESEYIVTDILSPEHLSHVEKAWGADLDVFNPFNAQERLI